LSDEPLDPELSLPFPVEFVIQDTPRSLQASSAGKERWRQTVGAAAKVHADSLRDFFMIDKRALAATIYYFPPAPLGGDVDNIVKLILDGMCKVLYPDDRLIERVIVQKFEPGVSWRFASASTTLDAASVTEPPVLYIRLDDDLGWREVA
jgi:crossover junction endodeoxyribonuclease RusA